VVVNVLSGTCSPRWNGCSLVDSRLLWQCNTFPDKCSSLSKGSNLIDNCRPMWKGRNLLSNNNPLRKWVLAWQLNPFVEKEYFPTSTVFCENGTLCLTMFSSVNGVHCQNTHSSEDYKCQAKHSLPLYHTKEHPFQRGL
jgi:hypothetical protein